MHMCISGNGKRLVESHSIFSVSSSRFIQLLLHFRVGLTAGASTTVSDAGWCLMWTVHHKTGKHLILGYKRGWGEVTST